MSFWVSLQGSFRHSSHSGTLKTGVVNTNRTVTQKKRAKQAQGVAQNVYSVIKPWTPH